MQLVVPVPVIRVMMLLTCSSLASSATAPLAKYRHSSAVNSCVL